MNQFLFTLTVLYLIQLSSLLFLFLTQSLETKRSLWLNLIPFYIVLYFLWLVTLSLKDIPKIYKRLR